MTARTLRPKLPKEFSELSRRVLRFANRGVARIDFLREVSRMLADFSRCDALELRLKDSELSFRWEASWRPRRSARFVVLTNGPAGHRAKSRDRSGLEALCEDVLRGRLDSAFWTGDTHRLPQLRSNGAHRSLAIFRFAVDDKSAGILLLKSLRPNHFTRQQIDLYEGFADTLGLAIATRKVQWALRERVKELTCLYGIARIAQESDVSLAKTLQHIAELLPPAWQYPAIACGRIILDGHAYSSRRFRDGPHRQTADIVVSGIPRGVVEVVYTRDGPELAERPFLKEEQSLIDTIAQEVALIIHRRDAEDQRLRLQAQLRHADRLATIGQLAAGVAHELNEPLGNILGFAQLAAKEPGLPRRSSSDIDKIVKATLHAREVIQKLLTFARQRTPAKTEINLNQVVQEGLYFLESRCSKAGINLVRILADDMPTIRADASQLHQVLVNLVVNAVQAMPSGGSLTIETSAADDSVSLIVKDTGLGMTEAVLKKLYTPFFTTKDVNQGTGLGLAVVHGIVAAHGGTIQAESQPGRGARFEVRLPRAAAAETGT